MLAPAGPRDVATGGEAIGAAGAAEPVDRLRTTNRPGWGGGSSRESRFLRPIRGGLLFARLSTGSAMRGCAALSLHPWLQPSDPLGPHFTPREEWNLHCL